MLTRLESANLLDFGEIQELEKVCFGQDAWSVLDMIPVLMSGHITRFKLMARLTEADREHLAGFAAVDIGEDDSCAWLITIGIAPDFRCLGLGSLLLEACEQAASSFPKMRLTVAIENYGAIALYEKYGYRRIGEITDYYSAGRNALIMEKDL